MATLKIKTHSTESFRESFMHPGQQLDELLKSGINTFFIVKVEEMIRQIKLPVPPTRSLSHTLIYITEGEAIMKIGPETYTVHQQECLVVPAGQVFSFNNIDLNTGYLCHFNNDMLAGKFGTPELVKAFHFLHIWANPLISPDPQTSGFVLHILQRLLLEYTSQGLCNIELLQSYLLALLCEINKACQPATNNLAGNTHAITNRFKALLFTHIRSKHRVSDYAALLNITPNHLNKSVKAATGKSPTKWIDEAIVLESKVLLHQSSLSISEIAAALGLDDPSYFSRLFKKYEQVTPLRFRQMIEKS
jgi:AraC family transcriptional activator of pobA